MLEQQATCMRGNHFDRIEIMADRHAETLRRLRASYDLEHFNTGLYAARRLPTPEKITLGLKVDVERVRLERLFSQPLLPQLMPRQSPA